MNDAKCKGCGKTIRFVKTHVGKFVPLDLGAPVYQVVTQFGQHVAEMRDDMFVTHFATCSKANDFSKGAKAK